MQMSCRQHVDYGVRYSTLYNAAYKAACTAHVHPARAVTHCPSRMSETSIFKDSSTEVKLEGLYSSESQNSSEIDDALPSASSAAGDSVSSSDVEQTATGTGRKRKFTNTTAHKLKRLKTRYNDHYRELFNETLDAALSKSSAAEYEPLSPSQYGLSWWTSAEKATFFDELARREGANIRKIASAVGTKSEIEVRAYTHLLQKASVTRLRESPPYPISLIDIPAAAEIGEECCRALEKHAQSLSLLQQKHEERLEQEKHADLWLLTDEVAQWVEAHLVDDDAARANVLKQLPGVSLLNLPKWLQLSERVFMNPAPPRDGENWQVLAGHNETPSILHTAFSDFHTLAISVTRRLIQSSLFYATSRLRATDSSRYRYQPVVRAKDVKVAVRVLGMQPDSNDFWTRVPRRCGLNVTVGTSSNGRRKAKLLGYDEVERLLRRSKIDEEEHKHTQTISNANSETYLPEHNITHPSQPTDADLTTSEEQESDAPCQMSDLFGSRDWYAFIEDEEMQIDPDSRHLQRQAQHQLECEQEEYAEEYDRHASLTEEQRLWETLEEIPKLGLKAERLDPFEKLPTGKNPNYGTVDWKEKLDFWSEWEVYQTPVPLDHFDQRGKSVATRPFATKEADPRDCRGRSPDIDRGIPREDARRTDNKKLKGKPAERPKRLARAKACDGEASNEDPSDHSPQQAYHSNRESWSQSAGRQQETDSNINLDFDTDPLVEERSGGEDRSHDETPNSAPESEASLIATSSTDL